jgi:hypothetical protein
MLETKKAGPNRPAAASIVTELDEDVGQARMFREANRSRTVAGDEFRKG